MLRRISMALLAAVVLHGQGTRPKAKPADYHAHARVAGFELAADYLAHSMLVEGGVIDVSEYLVIEVAVFPAAGETTRETTGDTPSIKSEEFTLRLNGRKAALLAQTPGMVAASLKYADWEVRRRLQASAGVGDTGVIVGRPPVTERFPGDPRPRQSRLPRQPKAPDETNPSGEEKPSEMPIEERVQGAAFPDGVANRPVSGYLFFPFRGKTKSIRSLELRYESSDGNRTATLALF